MTTPRKPPKKKVAPGQGKATSRNAKADVLKCGTHHINKVRNEIHAAGLSLDGTSGGTQLGTLLRVLQYLGPRGINTKEAEGCGYFRIATRIQELEDAGWKIAVPKERIIGADGLIHKGIARYTLLGRRSDFIDQQGSLDLGAPA